ncbi:MAG: threonine aldolase family protein [Dysgonomonas sp.]
MFVHNFTNDYTEGCHQSVLDMLAKTNLVQQSGYGDDEYTLNAISQIRQKIGDPHADVYLIAGGTLTNLVVLASILKPFESVISASTGHINTHETGAIEATGHKVEDVQTPDGKLRVSDIVKVLDKSPEYHTVKSRVVYISNSTEVGTIYNKQELTDLSRFCRENGLILYMDGARLPSALMADSNDLTLQDVAVLTDVFYLGATKCGALLGEAVVISNNDLKPDFKYHLKQRGAMLAKGRMLGIQFDQLLRNDLLFSLARHSNRMAAKITDAVKQLGYPFLTESDTNQIFPVFPLKMIAYLENLYGFYVWEKVDEDHAAIRLITSWATPETSVDMFINDLKELSTKI